MTRLFLAGGLVGSLLATGACGSNPAATGAGGAATAGSATATATTATAAATATLPAAACAERAAELGRWLKLLADDSKLDWLRGPGTARLVAIDGPAPDEPGPVLEVTPAGATFDGALVWEAGAPLAGARTAIAGALARMREMTALLKPGTPLPPVVLAVDRVVPFATVADMASALAAAGTKEAHLLFDAPVRLAPPEPSAIDAEVAAIRASDDLSTKGMRLAALGERLFGPCPSIAERLGALAAASPETRSALFASAMAEGLAECNCAVDVPSARTFAYALLSTWRSPLSVVRIALAAPGAGDARKIAAAGALPWADAAPLVLEGLRGAYPVAVQLVAR